MVLSASGMMFCVFILLLLILKVCLLRYLIWEMPPLHVIYKTLGRDVRAIIRYFKVQLSVYRCYFLNLSVIDVFREVLKRNPNKICFMFEDNEWTYQQVDEYSNQVANYFLAAGYRKGEEVALFMENCPEYVCIWLGLAKIGVVSALINTNLRLQALANSINAIQAKSVIFNGALTSAIRDVVDLLDRKEIVDYYCFGKPENGGSDTHLKSLELALQDASKSAPNIGKHKIGFQDKLLYIYTSGTTGLPKAAIIRHSRYIVVGAISKHVVSLTNDEVYYNPLPMYHSAGGMLLVSVVLSFGGTMFIRKKFSASNYWKDAAKCRATVGQYIGEMCRYLLNQPRSPDDSRHSIRIMYGNGLRPQIWQEFQTRFGIETIVELYGATEGNSNLMNMFGKPGAVGFISRTFSGIYPVRLIKVDLETGEPVRDINGICVMCKPGEPGEIVGKIRQSPINAFDGYVNRKATEKKIVRDCFTKGDMAFLSGDILVMDDYGYLYFQDRTGDTFRWKGENVSTSEVESIISKVLKLAACVVYGVEVPGSEGKAGMVAIQSKNELDMDKLYPQLKFNLPSYAVPYFIRICRNIETTGTYKLKKTELQKQGYNLDMVPDPLFFLDVKKGRYIKLDKVLYSQILKGYIRF